MVPSLTTTGCRARQTRLKQALAEQNLDAALVCDPRHVHYFTSYWGRSIYTPVALIQCDGPTLLSIPSAPHREVTADEALVYESNHMGTMVESQWEAALAPLAKPLAKIARLGCDGLAPLALGRTEPYLDLTATMLQLRRAKDADEIAILRSAIAATEAAYQYAKEHLAPGVTEIELFAGMQAAVIKSAGEPVGEMGNDFQVGSPGGPPRLREAQAGEVAVLDVSVVVRGYSSDLCRSFVVGEPPSEMQQAAYQRVLYAISEVEKACRPGASCRELFQLAVDLLGGYRGWRFGHHLGHGIGLSPHESPRINPQWDDTLQLGDVFTIEPGLYADELRAGLRLENNYYLSPDGLVRLSHFPMEIG